MKWRALLRSKTKQAHCRKQSFGARRLTAELLELRAAPATFTVNNGGDDGDSFADDNICDTANNPTTEPPTPPSGICTLRAAIGQSNKDAGLDTIVFSVLTVNTSGGITATGRVNVDGSGVAGCAGPPVVSISGSGGGSALIMDGGNSQVCGLAINGFGISGVSVRSDGNLIQGNRIGVNLAGTVVIGNLQDGIQVLGSNNTIGGTTVADRNIVSGNGSVGINILSGSGNLVIGNYVGTDVNGTVDFGNGSDGIGVQGTASTIGGTTAASRNIISGNGGMGVHITGGSGHMVVGNFIGTDVNGTVDLGNDLDGVHIAFSTGSTIGGTTAGARNIISGNNNSGVRLHAQTSGNLVQGNFIGTDVTGMVALGNTQRGVWIEGAFQGFSNNNTIGGTTTEARNVISGNSLDGIEIRGSQTPGFGATGNLVQGNFIGTKINGTEALPNSLDGVYIENATNNTIGGSVSARNIISGNLISGVEIFDANSTGNVVQSNFIGTDVNGTAALGNGSNGVLITNARQNTIGGDNVTKTALTLGNLISGNGGDGVEIAGTASGNAIQGNFIGTKINGDAPLGNAENGIFINGAANNTIGLRPTGDSDGARNIISGNTKNGIKIFDTTASGNRIAGNLIGTDITGKIVDTDGNLFNGNNLGNGESGVFIVNAPSNTITGTSTSIGTVISGNNQHGVFISGSSAANNVVEKTAIGSDQLGRDDLGNRMEGVRIEDAPNNTIGSLAAGAGNVISGNGDHGVHIKGVSASGNHVLGNIIGLKDIDAPAEVLRNAGDGVFIENAPNNVIGRGTGRNVISGNVGPAIILSFASGSGVRISGSTATGNAVEANFIGTDKFGDVTDPDGTPFNSDDLGNALDGVLIEAGASNNTIGGVVLGESNIIAGNVGSGVGIFEAGTTGNVVQGNFIGTNRDGLALGNFSNGILILSGASKNTIGGQANVIGEPPANVISGNVGNGIKISITGTSENLVEGNIIGLKPNGTDPLPNGLHGILIADGASNNTIGGVGGFGHHNLIAGNANDGVRIDNAVANLVQNNNIGFDKLSVPQPNEGNGVLIINGADDNTIGGAAVDDFNIIAGNDDDGIEIDGSQHTVVHNNFIGTNGDGTEAIPNGGDGVFLTNGARDNTIGGAGGVGVDGNVISGNGSDGIEIAGLSSTGNVIFGNRIGTNKAGNAALPNGAGNNLAGNGIVIFDAPDNIIGDAGVGNLISGNDDDGIQIDGATAARTIIRSNIIGTDQLGNVAIPNGGDGIFITGSPDNTIGGGGLVNPNLIAGNGDDGIDIFGVGATGNVIQGNFIGADFLGVLFPNAEDGILIEDASNNTVGGLGLGNTVGFNGGAGIAIRSGTGNRLQENSIFSNTGLGIDLNNDGVTPNDPGDGDTNANNLQNYPALFSAMTDGTNTFLGGSLQSQPGNYTLEFYTNSACDPSGFGEGEFLLFSTPLAVGANGIQAYNITIGALPVGTILTATATNDTTKDTSEFSRCLAVIPVVQLGSLHGQKFNDLDGDGLRDATEPGLNGWEIQLLDDSGHIIGSQLTMDMDLNADLNIDPITERGLYWFEGFPPDTYEVREVLQSSWLQSTPEFTSTLNGASEVPPSNTVALGSALLSLNEATNQLHFQINFSGLTGTSNGLHLHRGAVGQDGPIVYDLAAAAGVTTGFTSPVTGTVTINPADLTDLDAGNFYINLHTTTFSGGEIRGQVELSDSYLVTLGAGETITGLDFGNVFVAMDFGDAPDPTYPTLFANDGARHVIGGLQLGAAVDAETDGQPNASATGDDTSSADDENGISFTGSLVTGQFVNVQVTASTAGKLDAWIDFNDDGDWNDASEQIFTSQSLVAGTNSISFAVPAGATVTAETFARFRFSSTGGLAPTGLATDGEVEDYAVAITAVPPGENPGTIQFTTTTITAPEGGTSLVVTVRRTGGSDGTVTVNFGVTGGNATSGSDFTLAAGALVFADGETTKTFTVNTIDDPQFEGIETLTLSLSSPTGGAIIGTVGSTTITFGDNDTAQSASFREPDGDLVTVQLSGVGTLTVNTDSGDAEIDLPLTDLTNSLIFKVTKSGAGDGFADIGSIEGAGGLRLISGKGVNLVGDGITLGGALLGLTLRDILNGADVSAGGSSALVSSLNSRVIEDGTVIDVDTTIKSLTVARIGKATITAPSIAKLTVRGDSKLGVVGDMEADITLTGDGVLPGKATLGSAKIAGAIRDAMISIIGGVGGIGKIAAAQIIGTVITAGFTPTDAEDPFAGGVFLPGLLIKSVALKGIGDPDDPAYQDSLIAGAQIGSIKIASAETANGGDTFGVLADVSIGSVNITTPGFVWNAAVGGDQSTGDFHVTIL